MAGDKDDIVRWGDLAAGFGLLTRLPVPVDFAAAQARGGAAAWTWPVVGACVGLAGAVAGGLGLWLGLPVSLAAVVVLLAQVMLTGAMHEDGLADSADGLWGGQTRDRRLEIMKDSRTGAYGVIALVLALLMRWAGVVALMQAGGLWGGLIAVGALSRLPMIAIMSLMPAARAGGLSRSVGRPGRATFWLGIAIGLGLAALFAGPASLMLALVTAGAALAVGLIARAKIGGQTGDILGASQQVAEIAALAALASLWQVA